MKYLELNDISAYRIATELSDYVYAIVSKWEWFSKRTLGAQWTEAIDSIAGNIAEGFGRFHKKDKQKFYYNARGSAYESIHWTKRAIIRKLISSEESKHILSTLEELPREINYQIAITEKKLQK